MNAATTRSEPMTERIAQTCLCRRVQHASRVVGKRFDDALRPLGLNNWQFTLLIALTTDEPRSVNQIAAELGMDRTTATKNLALLERRGLIEARVDEMDRRVRRNMLTEAGRSLQDRAALRWQQVNGEIASGLKHDQLAALQAALDALADG
jgi:DNA-binding MarR family transcriptional regulator